MNEALALIKEAISVLKRRDPSRENSLAITKLQEAYLWLRFDDELKDKKDAA